MNSRCLASSTPDGRRFDKNITPNGNAYWDSLINELALRIVSATVTSWNHGIKPVVKEGQEFCAVTYGFGPFYTVNGANTPNANVKISMPGNDLYYLLKVMWVYSSHIDGHCTMPLSHPI